MLMELWREHWVREKRELGLEGCCGWEGEAKQGSVGFTVSSHPRRHRARVSDCPSLHPHDTRMKLPALPNPGLQL